ncbi:MAG: hypothetical protein OXG79_10285 [Chloroflexi bacterium]|nr:hypothetical protein [Chloroflexota bacterium]MCY4111062.1 hypothetical protein [Chloroflexota bacterium]
MGLVISGPSRRSVPRLLAALALAATLTAASHPAVSAQDSGGIRGTVVNGTSGAAIPTDLVVALVGRQGPDALPTRTTGVNDDGTFVFTDLPRTADAAYFAHVDYQGVSYATDGVSFDGRTEVETTLTIYESTAQNPGISLQSVSRLMRHQTADAIAILDVIDVLVPGDRTFLSTASTTAPPPLRFAVPDGAFGLQPVSGFTSNELVIGGPGFAVLAPLRPGVTTIAYAYQLRLVDGAASFDWLIGLPAGVVRLLSEQDVLVTTPQGLAPGDATSFAGIAVDRWEARDVAARTTFAIEVADTTLPGIVRAIRTTTADRWALIAAGVGIVLTLIVAVQRRVWRARPAPDDLARARGLLAKLHDSHQRTDPEHEAMREELVDLIERRPDLAVELRRDRAAQGPGS